MLCILSQVWQEQCPNQNLAMLPQVLQNGLNLTSKNVTWHGSLPGPPLTTCPYWRVSQFQIYIPFNNFQLMEKCQKYLLDNFHSLMLRK